MAVRQQDIAEHLGLSIGTVSLALRGAPQVALKTKHRVWETATRLGYVYRSHEAVQPGFREVTFACRFGPDNLFYAGVLAGVEKACRAADLTLRYSQIATITPKTLRILASADALLLAGAFPQETIAKLRQQRPLVLIENNPPDLACDRVLVENMSSVRRTVTHLAQGGHERIAFLYATEATSFEERLMSYRATIAELGLTPLELPLSHAWSVAVEKTLGAYLETHPRPPFSALLSCNDETAISAVSTLQRHGVRVPEDVSVFGFDDVTMARAVHPALSTSHVPREYLGEVALGRLRERARHPDAPPLSLLVHTTLVIRDSSSPRHNSPTKSPTKPPTKPPIHAPATS